MGLHSVVVWLVLFSSVAFSAHAAEQKEKDEIGLDQKLERLYQFYRAGETISLKPREIRFSLGVAYAVDEEVMIGVRASRRSLGLQGAFAYGLADWLEVGISVPVRWDTLRIESADTVLAREGAAGIGDMGTRFITRLPVRAFEVTGILTLTFPTGKDALGERGMQSSFGINIAKTIRPAFLFGGLAWQRNWQTARDVIVYTGGMGFYLNHALSAGVELAGTRFLNPPRGGAHDMATATIQVSYQMSPSLGITPYVSFGLTDSAPDAVIGFSVLWRP